MTRPTAAEAEIRARHAQAVSDIQNRPGSVYSTRIAQDSYSIHMDRAALLSILDAREVVDASELRDFLYETWDASKSVLAGPVSEYAAALLKDFRITRRAPASEPANQEKADDT